LSIGARVTQIKNYAWGCSQIILVANKCDMEDERVVSTERGKQLADQLGLDFFETSAKENVNVRVNEFGNSFAHFQQNFSKEIM
jgi:GTPase SAR1 family protein